MGITSMAFLDQLNPMFGDGQDALAPYTTSLDAFNNSAFQILVLNNSVLAYSTNEKIGWAFCTRQRSRIRCPINAVS